MFQITASGHIYSKKYKTPNTLTLEERPISLLSKTLYKVNIRKRSVCNLSFTYEMGTSLTRCTLQTDHKNLTYFNTEIKQKSPALEINNPRI
jgi:hypothetical protein